MKTYENAEKIKQAKQELRDAFLIDSRVRDMSDWIMLDGIQYCIKCKQPYPLCFGNCYQERKKKLI